MSLSNCTFQGSGFSPYLAFRVQTFEATIGSDYVPYSDQSFYADSSGTISFTRPQGATIQVEAPADVSFVVPVTATVPASSTYDIRLLGNIAVSTPPATGGFTVQDSTQSFRAGTFKFIGSGITLTESPSGVANLVVTAGGGLATANNDTNVTGTLSGGGTILTLGWQSTLALSRGGLGAALSAPSANKLLAWDNTDGANGFWSLGTNLSYDHSTRTLNATGGLPTGATTSGSDLTLAGKLTLPASGVVFDNGIANLTNIISIGTDAPQRWGLAVGSSGSPVTSRFPTISAITYTQPASGGGFTTVPYFFATVRSNGGAQNAVYNVLGYATTADNNASNQDIVGIAGIAVAQSGSTSRPFGGYFVGSINNQNTGQGAIGLEADSENLSGVDAPAITGSLPAGFCLGVNIAPKGGKLSSAAINIQGGGATAWRTGIHFPNDVIASGGYGIDFKYATRGTPIRLANNDLGIVARKALDDGDRSLLKFDNNDVVQIANDGNTTAFGGAIQPGAGSFASNTRQIYTDSNNGIVITGGGGSVYDLLLGSRSGARLLAVIANTSDPQLGDSTNKVYIGAGGLATNATVGFPCLPDCGGAPTGAPTVTTGYLPVVLDSGANKLWVRFGSTWRFVTFT